jgi:hypothetical protein
MSAVLSVTQPELYALNRESLLRLSERGPELKEHVAAWGFAFNAVTVISNRSSPNHRDQKSGRPEYSDVLLSLGGDSETVLELVTLGIRCRYSSGSVAVFSGNVILHAVSESVNDRVCIAGYTRPAVHCSVGLGATSWAKLDELIDK